MILFLLAACNTSVLFPPDDWPDAIGVDTGGGGMWGFGESEIDARSTEYGCQGGAGLQVDVWTWGQDGAVRADVLGPGNGLEIHPLAQLSDFDGRQQYRLGPLTMGADSATLGSSTTWACTDVSAMTFVVRLDDANGDLVDCIAWGADYDRADAYTATEDILGIGGCRWFGSL